MRHASLVPLLLSALIGAESGHAQGELTGVQDPAWAPDGKRIAVSYFDRIWTMTPDGRQAKALAEVPGSGVSTVRVERDPAWSPDGSRIAFAVDRGQGYDIYTASVRTGALEPVTTMAGDERWPSWTPDGRLVFAHREAPAQGRTVDPGLQWDLFQVAAVAGSAAWQAPVPLTRTDDSETEPRVSPDGERVVFVSNRESEDDVDLWAMSLPSSAVMRPTPLADRKSVV